MWGNLSKVDVKAVPVDSGDLVACLNEVQGELDKLKGQHEVEVVQYVCPLCGGICDPVLLSGESFSCQNEFSVSEYILKVIPGTYAKNGKYLHECRECGQEHWLEKVYPDLLIPCV